MLCSDSVQSPIEEYIGDLVGMGTSRFEYKFLGY